MLNGYFAFGVPFGLFFLYAGIYWFRKKSSIPYLGFGLFLIAGFLSAFSFQVIQVGIATIKTLSPHQFKIIYGYSYYFLYVPFLIGLTCIVVNSYRGFKRLQRTWLLTHQKPKKK